MIDAAKNAALLSLAQDALAYWATPGALEPRANGYYLPGACCLVTAAFMKDQPPGTTAGVTKIFRTLKERYKLSDDELDAVIDGFDAASYAPSDPVRQAAMALGKSVRAAVLTKDGKAVPPAALKVLASRPL